MQSPPVLVTSRQVQNAHTGLDLTVPQHQEVRGGMMSGHVEYQILAVTRLAAFKSAKHRPEDVVQFLVSKKYSEIEEFYQKLSSRYPAASLPPLPRKVLFVGESDIRERRAVFDEILRCVAKDAELAGSPELLEFLGTRSPGAADLTSREVSVLDTDSHAGDAGEAFDFFQQQEQAEGPPSPGQKDEGAEESSEEEEALDPLGIMRSKKPKKRPEAAVKPRPRPSPRLTIFDEEADPDKGLFRPGSKLSPQRPAEDTAPRDPLKLFDDPDLGGAVALGDPLLLPAACASGGPTARLGHREAPEDLFRYHLSSAVLRQPRGGLSHRAADLSQHGSSSLAFVSGGGGPAPRKVGSCGRVPVPRPRPSWGPGEGRQGPATQRFPERELCACIFFSSFHTHSLIAHMNNN
ncbi:HCLS1 binding protein 3 [Phyllostomus discolor]|uniref:HCLS1-binding protein 3 n=1 Tax=Phyllostomus discolor TaxID=89673 RepID=A0A834E4Q7_9CHIR|nr:HCLS1 binding protein 3 [Phyllostomus discolor]